MRKLLIIPIILSLVIGIFFTSISAQEEYTIPSWVKGVAGFWSEDKITDQDFGDALTFLITEEIIQVPQSQAIENTPSSEEILLSEENSQLQNKILQLQNDNLQLQNEILQLETDKSSLQNDNSQLQNKISQLENEITILKENNPVETMESSLTVSTDKQYPYEDGDLVKISGMIVGIEGIAVSLEVTNPDGNVIHSEGLSPRSDGSFSTSFVMGDSTFDEFGKYDVTVEFGSVEATTSFWYNPS